MMNPNRNNNLKIINYLKNEIQNYSPDIISDEERKNILYILNLIQYYPTLVNTKEIKIMINDIYDNLQNRTQINFFNKIDGHLVAKINSYIASLDNQANILLAKANDNKFEASQLFFKCKTKPEMGEEKLEELAPANFTHSKD